MKNIVRVLKNDSPSLTPANTEYFEYLFDAKSKDGKKYYMLKLHQPSSKINNKNFTNVVNNKRFTTVGSKEALSNFLDEHMENDKVPGRIFIREFAEDAVPEKYKIAFYSEDDADPAEKYLKKAGGDEKAPVLMYYESRILSFKIYVQDVAVASKMKDEFLQHTNIEEVAQWRLANGLKDDINSLDLGEEDQSLV